MYVASQYKNLTLSPSYNRSLPLNITWLPIERAHSDEIRIKRVAYLRLCTVVELAGNVHERLFGSGLNGQFVCCALRRGGDCRPFITPFVFRSAYLKHVRVVGRVLEDARLGYQRHFRAGHLHLRRLFYLIVQIPPHSPRRCRYCRRVEFIWKSTVIPMSNVHLFACYARVYWNAKD